MWSSYKHYLFCLKQLDHGNHKCFAKEAMTANGLEYFPRNSKDREQDGVILATLNLIVII